MAQPQQDPAPAATLAPPTRPASVAPDAPPAGAPAPAGAAKGGAVIYTDWAAI